MPRALVLFAAAVGLVGCSGGNPLRETALGISSAASIARAAALTMQAVPGTATASACVQVTSACSSYPCSGAATVNLGADCPLPLGGAASGSVMVTAQLSSATQATLVEEFVNVEVEKSPIALAKVMTVNVQENGDM